MRVWLLVLSLAGCDRVAGFVTHDLSAEPLLASDFDLGCTGFAAPASLPPVGLLFLLDRSGSMGDGVHGDPALKWQPVSAALEAFFPGSASKGVSASLQYFPQPDICTADAYRTPAVDLRSLPDLSFATSLAAATPGGGKPTLPAVQGTIRYARDQLVLDSSQQLAMVLITDGDPDTCSTGVDNVPMALGQAASQVPTFVIGVGGELAGLSQWAQAGGTGSATLLAVGDPATTKMQLGAALDTIRGLVSSCGVALPPVAPGTTIDYSQINVTFAPSTGGEPELWVYDPSCAGRGWRYDDPANPARIVLCPAACDIARSDGNGTLDVLFGCGTVGGPVR